MKCDIEDIRIARLRREHSALDDEIGKLQKRPLVDDVEIKKLKRKKLSLKDVIEGIVPSSRNRSATAS